MTDLGDADLRQALDHPRYPRSSRYDPRWTIESDMGPNVLWLTEALCEYLPLEPGMRVLDLGCGNASSSVFLAREFDVSVWAVDLTIKSTPNWRRVRDAGLADRVFPLRIDARTLPFPEEFFDAIVSVSAYQYFGTDDTYLRRLAPLLVPGGRLGVIVERVTEEIDGPPEHFKGISRVGWETLHSAEWWRRQLDRSRLVDVEVADEVPDGWRDWLRWKELMLAQGVRPGLTGGEVKSLHADGGRLMSLVRVVTRRHATTE